MMKNRLKHWRHRCELERDEFADFVGEPYNQYTKWETNRVQPSIAKLWAIWLKLREKFPDINLQDLLEEQ